MNWRPLISLPAWVVLGVVAASGIGFRAAVNANNWHLQKKPIYAEDGRQLASLPRSFPGWEQFGSDDQPSKEILEELGTTNQLSRWYKETNPADPEQPRAFQFHAAYYTGKVDTVPHVPERCYVAGGVQRSGASIPNITVPLDISRLRQDTEAAEQFKATERFIDLEMMYRKRSEDGIHRAILMPAGIEQLRMFVTPFSDGHGGTFYAGYFFLANGGTVASADQVRLLAHQLEDDYSYYCKVQFMSPHVDSAEGLGELAAQVLDEIMGDLMLCVPDWSLVLEGSYPPAETSEVLPEESGAS